MEKAELIKIVIATVVAVVVKDIFTWLIKTIKPVATMLAKITGSWIVTHLNAIDFALDVGFLIWLIGLFLYFPTSDQPVTHNSVREQFMLAFLILFQLFHLLLSLIVWLREARNRK